MNPGLYNVSEKKGRKAAETGKKNERIKEEERGGASRWLRTGFGGEIDR